MAAPVKPCPHGDDVSAPCPFCTDARDHACAAVCPDARRRTTPAEVCDAEFAELRRSMWLRMRAEWPELVCDGLIDLGAGYLLGLALGLASVLWALGRVQ